MGSVTMNMDLKDADVYVVDYKKISEHEGSSGSFTEPAHPPEVEFEITKISIESLQDYDPEYTAEVLSLKVGDTIDIDFWFDFHEEIGEKANAEITSSKAPVKSVKVVDDGKALEIGTSIYATWVGDTPPQSDAGRG